MAFSYQVAKEVLSDKDKDRCLYLNCDPQSINWEKATKDFGCASVESMRVMTRGTLKKIENAGGREGVAASPAKGAAKKRKGKADTPIDTGDDEETPKPKKARGKKARSESTTPVEDGESAIKSEGGDELA